MNIINNNIIVNLHIDKVTDLETPVKTGTEKEIIFTVELLKVWKYWPDEFLVSKKISKIVKYDNLRERYKGTSFDGINKQEKHFNDYESMRDWLFDINSVNLANVKELESGNYYVRIVVESKSLEQPPLLGFLMLFIPEIEMSLAKESEPFHIGVEK